MSRTLTHTLEAVMLRMAILFLVISLIAALFGFGGISAAAAGFAQVLFFLFLVMFLVFLVLGLIRGSATAV